MRPATLVAALATLAALGVPAAAHAAPANDAPTGAIEFSAVTAEDGTPTERQGIADLDGATADAGVPRCLGPSSFATTVWFRVPASAAPKLVRVTGTGGSGQSAAQPDLAAFVVAPGAAPAQPQACDGGEVEPAIAGGDDGGAPEVDVRVPAGRDVLVQVGRPDGQAPERVVLSSAELALPALGALTGDVAGDAPTVALGSATGVSLAGATVTEEDPAQPACPASGTAWRRFVAVATGTQQLRVAGDAVSSLTAFVGAAPTADDAVDCRLRSGAGAQLSLDVPAVAGQVVWVRLGSESSAADAAGTLAVGGPGTPLPGGPLLPPGTPGGPVITGAPGTGTGTGTTPAKVPSVTVGLIRKRRAARLTVRGGVTLRAFKVTIQRRVGSKYRTVARASRAASLASGKRATVTLKRVGKLSPRGRYRIIVTARTATTPSRTVSQRRTRTLGEL